MVFTNSEVAEFEAVMQREQQNVMRGKKPSLSSVLMGLQFASVVPDSHGKMWFQEDRTIVLMVASVRKLMDDNPRRCSPWQRRRLCSAFCTWATSSSLAVRRGLMWNPAPKGRSSPTRSRIGMRARTSRDLPAGGGQQFAHPPQAPVTQLVE